MCADPGPGYCCSVYLWAGTPLLLKLLCCDWEQIAREWFPGFVCETSVLFRHCCWAGSSGDALMEGPVTVYQWLVDPGTVGSVGLILSQKRLDLKINAEQYCGGGGRCGSVLSIKAWAALNPLRFVAPQSIVVSHCLADGSVRVFCGMTLR